MDKTVLQVPMSKALRDKATKAVKRAGFSSLQEFIRVYLTSVSDQILNVHYEHPPVKLSKRAARRYDKMSEEVRSGKVKTKKFSSEDSIDDIMNWLNS